ncbi:MAG: tetratricopeptide repeat protein [Vicinamibacteria bacterium]
MNLRPRFLHTAALSAATFVLPALALSSPGEPWALITIPASRTTVVTDAGDKAGRKAALQIAEFDRSLAKRFAWIKLDDTTPLMVFASPDEATVRQMAPDSTDADKDNALSSYAIGANQHVGAMRTDLPEPADKELSPARGFYRGRAAYLIERSLGRAAPPWLARGLVSFLSDAVVRDKEMLVGRMTGADGAITPLPAPASADFFRETRPADRKFDLQAGFFIHYLLTADGGKNAAALDALGAAISARDTAATQSAQTKITALYRGFAKYLASKKFSPIKLPIDASINAAAFESRPLPEAEAVMLRAEVLFEMNRPVDTRGLLRLAKAADPTLVRPLEIEAILFEREQRTAESKAAIEAAIQLGSKNGGLYYRLAQLQWTKPMAKPALEATRKLLEQARDLSPDDANVLAYLAEVEGDLGLSEAALENAQKAAAAAPADVYAQMALARAQWNSKQVNPAIATAKVAIPLAKLASQKQSVQQFTAFAARNKTAQAKGTAPYKTQFGPPPAGAFGATRAVASPNSGSARVSIGAVQTGSTDASAITDCFSKRDDAACARAVPSLEGACAEKQAASCVSLGSLYDGGFGVTRDRRKAAANYKTACDLGEKPGCARLAVLEAQGLGVAKNTLRATKTLETLCGEQLTEGCVGLAQILQRTGRAADRTRAQTLLKAACDGGNAEACRLLTTAR